MDHTTLDQPGNPQGEFDFDARIEEITTNGYNFEIGNYLSKGHKILMQHFGAYIGYLLLVIVITMLLGVIPLVGSLANFIIGYPLIAGFYMVARRIYKNKRYQFSNFFDGFKFVGPLVLVRLVQLAILLAVAIPYILLAMDSDFLQMLWGIATGNISSFDPRDIVDSVAGFAPLILITLLIQALFTFSAYITVFARKDTWQAVKTSAIVVWKRFLHFILFFIVIFLINVAGAAAILIGLLYTIPLTLCSMYAAYESIIGTPSYDQALDDPAPVTA